MTDHANELRRYSRKIGHPAGDVHSVMLAAAEEIERLAARLEAAEKERDFAKAEIARLHDDIRELTDERDTLRAKIEAMERQEPVGWQTRTRPAWNDGTWGAWRKCSEEYAEDIKKTPSLHDWLYEARALYALPGAQTQGEER